MKRLLALLPVALLALAGCGGGSAASPGTASDSGEGPTTVVDIGSCDPYVTAAETYLGHQVEVMGTGDPCKFFVPEQVEINCGHYWMDVHFETFTLGEDERSAAAVGDLLGGLTTEQAPAGWTYAGSASGEYHYVVTAQDGTSLHCDASTQPGGGETKPSPGIDPVALLAFCDQIYDTAVEQ